MRVADHVVVQVAVEDGLEDGQGNDKDGVEYQVSGPEFPVPVPLEQSKDPADRVREELLLPAVDKVHDGGRVCHEAFSVAQRTKVARE